MSAFRVTHTGPFCDTCGALRPACCSVCRPSARRLRVHPLPGFTIDDLEPGDLLIREPDGRWNLERLPEVAECEWGWVA